MSQFKSGQPLGERLIVSFAGTLGKVSKYLMKKVQTRNERRKYYQRILQLTNSAADTVSHDREEPETAHTTTHYVQQTPRKSFHKFTGGCSRFPRGIAGIFFLFLVLGCVYIGGKFSSHNSLRYSTLLIELAHLLHIGLPVCISAACVQSSIEIISNMSPDFATTDPCIDFAEYTCGGWNENHQKTTSSQVSSTIDVLLAKQKHQLRGLLEGSSNSHMWQVFKVSKLIIFSDSTLLDDVRYEQVRQGTRY
jgi:hypothetical protein